MKKVNKTESKINTKARVASYRELVEGEYDVNSRLLLIQQLIPIGLLAVEEALQSEVSKLAGQRYSRECGLKRWGSNPGSVFLGNQKLSIRVPRLRDTEENEEVGLEAYRQFQSPQIVERGLRDENKLLFIIDGANGLRKGIQKVFGRQAPVQRCQWHKRKNVIAYLPKSQQCVFRSLRSLQ